MNDRKPRTIRRSVARKPRLLSRMTSIAYCSRSSNLFAILTLLNDQGTIIIGAYDQDLRTLFRYRLLDRCRNLFAVRKCETSNGRSRAAQKSAQSAGLGRSVKHPRHKWHRFFAERLMKAIHKCVTQISVLSGRERCGYQTGISQILDDGFPWKNVWYNLSCLPGLHLEARYEQHKLQRGIDVKSCDAICRLCDDGKPAEERRRCVVRVTFQFRAESANLFLRKTAFGDPVQPHKGSQPNGDTTAEPSCLRDIP